MSDGRTIWKSDDIFISTAEPLEPRRWLQLLVYVQKVLKPMEPTWNDDERMGFGFVGVGDDPMGTSE